MSDPRVLVVSIDGVVPGLLTPTVAPALTALARSGASCFAARTVRPAMTRPVHVAMLCGVDPSVRGVRSNDPAEPGGTAASVMGLARAVGRRTAVVHTDPLVDIALESGAADRRLVVGSGTERDDDTVVGQAIAWLHDGMDLVFAHLGGPLHVGRTAGSGVWSRPRAGTCTCWSRPAQGSTTTSIRPVTRRRSWSPARSSCVPGAAGRRPRFSTSRRRSPISWASIPTRHGRGRPSSAGSSPWWTSSWSCSRQART